MPPIEHPQVERPFRDDPRPAASTPLRASRRSDQNQTGQRQRPVRQNVLAAIPENLYLLLRLAREHIDGALGDPTAEFSQAVLKGIDAEINNRARPPFHYVFGSKDSSGVRSHRTFRLPLNAAAVRRLDEIEDTFTLSTRQAALTALARCALTPDGNVILRAMRHASARGQFVPPPPALDGTTTQFVKLPPAPARRSPVSTRDEC